ncbi:2-aminoethylphosphonate ABC transporter permease subunit [Gordonia polyisoprenivorans]|uniref:2-aminoethylphosphonate ABC transporter permease subunit n=1 Tax=Gordonia polyisoprenivorans TaxID=84595 RepID=UPI0022348175|nr:2-aminoethylphosphonate ABC transporter permease subunit [uncultured Gordonia sp.]UZF55233.1 2-aminoethylphosphonate ABC transporter permease subunit [Gordonia polyisoprenivorans]
MSAGALLTDNATSTPPPQPNRPLRSRSALWVWPPLVIVLIIAVYPLVRVLTESAGGTGESTWGAVLSSEIFRTALLRTAQVAVASTLGALILGTFLAIVLAFVPFPGSTIVARLIDTVLALPSFLITLAFTFLYGTAGAVNAIIADVTGSRPLNFLATPWGVIAAEITFFTPFVVRPLLASFATLSTDQLDVAASLGASPWRVLRSVIMPEAWPALMAGGSLVLLLTLNEFGIVLFTGAKDVITLPVLIYTRGIVTFDLAGAAVIATVQVALSLALYGIYRLIFARISGKRKGL